jgi:hypothetical protein
LPGIWESMPNHLLLASHHLMKKQPWQEAPASVARGDGEPPEGCSSVPVLTSTGLQAQRRKFIMNEQTNDEQNKDKPDFHVPSLQLERISPSKGDNASLFLGGGDRVSLCSPGWPLTCDLPASTSGVLGL